MNLTYKQTIALDALEDNETTEVLFGGGAGGGKSALGCHWILKSCLKYPGSRWLMGRSKLKTLKETTLNSLWDILKMQAITKDLYKYNSIEGKITFFNGSEILLKDLFNYPSDPEFDELGSLEITGAFIDECNQVVVKARNIVKSRIRYRLDEFGVIPKLLMTCNPARGWVYTEFYQPSKEGKLPKEKKFIQSLHKDNPYLSPHYAKNLDSLDMASRMRLKFGQWEYSDDPSRLVEYDHLIDLFRNDHVKGGRKYITADIARFGRDKTVICVWDGLVLVKIVSIDKNKVNEAADEITRLRKEYGVSLSNVITDSDGVGGGVEDILGCKGFRNNGRPIVTSRRENFDNLKSQCYFKLGDMIRSGGVWVKDDRYKDTIIEELDIQLRQDNIDKDGKKMIIKKEKVKEMIGRSPDYSDSIMMRMYFELNDSNITVW